MLLTQLNDDCLIAILKFLGITDLCRLMQTNHYLKYYSKLEIQGRWLPMIQNILPGLLPPPPPEVHEEFFKSILAISPCRKCVLLLSAGLGSVIPCDRCNGLPNEIRIPFKQIGSLFAFNCVDQLEGLDEETVISGPTQTVMARKFRVVDCLRRLHQVKEGGIIKRARFISPETKNKQQESRDRRAQIQNDLKRSREQKMLEIMRQEIPDLPDTYFTKAGYKNARKYRDHRNKPYSEVFNHSRLLHLTTGFLQSAQKLEKNEDKFIRMRCAEELTHYRRLPEWNLREDAVNQMLEEMGRPAVYFTIVSERGFREPRTNYHSTILHSDIISLVRSRDIPIPDLLVKVREILDNETDPWQFEKWARYDLLVRALFQQNPYMEVPNDSPLCQEYIVLGVNDIRANIVGLLAQEDLLYAPKK
jgi:hypothetical protein